MYHYLKSWFVNKLFVCNVFHLTIKLTHVFYIKPNETYTNLKSFLLSTNKCISKYLFKFHETWIFEEAYGPLKYVYKWSQMSFSRITTKMLIFKNTTQRLKLIQTWKNMKKTEIKARRSRWCAGNHRVLKKYI